MPLVRSPKHVSPDDWVVLVGSSKYLMNRTRKQGYSIVQNTEKLVFYLMSFRLHSGSTQGDTSWASIIGKPYSHGFIETDFRYHAEERNGLYTHGSLFAILNGKPPVGGYEHRRLLRRIASTYAPRFISFADDAWYKSYLIEEDA